MFDKYKKEIIFLALISNNITEYNLVKARNEFHSFYQSGKTVIVIFKHEFSWCFLNLLYLNFFQFFYIHPLLSRNTFLPLLFTFPFSFFYFPALHFPNPKFFETQTECSFIEVSHPLLLVQKYELDNSCSYAHL